MAKPRYTEEQYQYARYEANALEYARQRGYDLVKNGPQWRMREHDSMVFTEDGRWFWNSHALRGRAIEFAMHYEGLSLVEAVLSICGKGSGASAPPPSATTAKKPEKKPFVLPEKSEENKRLFAYLCGTRRLDREIVAELVRGGDIYESAQRYTKADGTTAIAHNAVFVGRDRDGVPKSAFQRGLSSLPGSKPFKRDVAGSDAAASFCVPGTEGAKAVAVFEASIDAISHATLEKLAGRDYRGIDRIALGGTEKTAGLLSYLDAHPDVDSVLLCYDEDAGGEAAVERTTRLLEGRGLRIERQHPAIGKDWNEYLCAMYQEPDELARDTLRQVMAEPGRFTRFLKTASNNYKYPFEDQLLIYAQRPDATACADAPTWEKLGRTVDGSKGAIALLGYKGEDGFPRVVFDVGNTTAPDGRALWLWRLGGERTAAAVDALGSMADTSEASLIAAVRTAVDAEIENRMGIQPEDGDPFAVLLRAGTNYAVLSRCGVNADAIYTAADFVALSRFFEPESARELGNAISDTARMLLRRVEAAEKRYEKNLRANLAMAKKRTYHEASKEERSAEHDREESDSGDIRAGGERGRGADRQVRLDAAEIPSEPPAEVLSGAAKERDTAGASAGDRPSGDGTDRPDHPAHGEGGRDGRGAEGKRPDEMGRPDEQLPPLRGGDRPADDRLRVSRQEEETKEAAADDAAASSLSQDEIDECIRTMFPGIEVKRAVVRYMKEHGREKDTAAWLASQYYDSDVNAPLHIARAVRVGEDDDEVVLPWPEVQHRIAQLIKAEKFYTPEEYDHMDDVDPIAIRERLPNVETVETAAAEPAQDSLSQSETDEYNSIKEAHPDELVLYQVGDFYELYGEDAKEAAALLDLRNITDMRRVDTGRIEVCSLPAVQIERYVEQLRDTWDVIVADAQDGRHTIREIPSFDHEAEHDIDAREAEYGADGSRAFPGNRPAEPEAGAEETPAPESVPAEKEKVLAPPAPKPRSKVSPFMLHPEIPTAQRHEYRITNDRIGEGTPLDRFYRNIRAIQLLKKIESEDRLALPTEQEFLAEYVGWGGLPQFFEEDNPHYGELKNLLTDEEYAAARESTLTAFYTPPTVIRAIYKALDNMGFQRGNILEPSCGVGNFLGMKPEKLADSKIYGVELDSISGRIARQLYQQSSIAVQGYEKTDLPDSFFDVALGNVPFGSFKVSDKRYDKQNFLIHDYFFAKTLDKVRPGGVIAFITSKGTLDKENPSVRKYIAQRADLLGAIRLPNTTFKGAAGTEVTSDIIFLQKRDTLMDIMPDWVHLGKDENGLVMNQYFIDHPEMILGEMREVSGPYGPETACLPYDDRDLDTLLSEAVQNITGDIGEYAVEELAEDEEDRSIPADPSVRNFSYTIVDGKIYYRRDSRMAPMDVSATAESRIKGLVGIRDCVRALIEYQTEDYPDSMIAAKQQELNELYDDFVKRYGRISSRANSAAFNEDSAYPLLSSLEVTDDEGNFVRKADMFSKRTIKQRVAVTSVDTASEALALSLAEKAKIDMDYMAELTGKTEEGLFADLKGVIFLNPLHTGEDSTNPKYLTADEYLSGNVREKLQWARRSAELYPDDYAPNVQALEAVQPTDLTAAEISVRLGATWLPTDVVEQFMYKLLGTPIYAQRKVKVHYSQHTGEWNVKNKSYDAGNVKANSTYGTNRINGYKLIEETLNLRTVRIFDYVEDEYGNRKSVLNKEETVIAQGKQKLIKQAFADWIWEDPQRRERLCKIYNEKFNSTRPREYDGSHLNFVGINPEITLRPHQVNAIAHILYGGNTLLAHVVGAGKTYEMVAAAMESKRLGLCQKSLFVVPNHLTEQWAAEFLQLYPAANILVATKKDFESKNRKRFCGRIATGDYDAVIIGHSQFEKIPMSAERQRELLERQKDEIMEGIEGLKRQHGESFSIKQMERSKKAVELKLKKLNDTSRKDDVVTFEELGVDRLFVDEAHYFKNLAAFSKMRNVGGISQTEAMKSSDLYMKCRYLDELTDGRGVIFATGTPISNSMVELYTMQKYLQYGALNRNDLLHFDAWASTFGETVTATELAPEGTGYRTKTRFAKFYNLPELMSMFREVADIQTADMLQLPVPKANYHNVVLKPSEHQKEMVAELSERAEKVRNREVAPEIDNMLKITNDGRKLALDQRLMSELLPDSETGKVAACAANVFEIWQRTTPEKSTQMVFCDLSTPHGDGKFNVYDDLRDKLIAKGIPAEEIAYIHNADTEAKKKELFGKVRNGQVRVLIGSTQKMGAGTNVQRKLVALHHLDCPWRPADLQQREGRIIRQGNENAEVDIYTYVTENTFDSYLYQLVEGKQKFIGQIMTSKSPVRSAEDVDEQALSYAEIKALCTGNPYIKEKMDLDIDVQRLKLLKSSYLSQKYALEDQIVKSFPQQISALEQRIEGYTADMARVAENTQPNDDGFSPMLIEGKTYTEKKAAGSAILEVCHNMSSPDPVPLGQYRGFDMELSFDSLFREYKIMLKGELHHVTGLGGNVYGNIQRLDNLIDALEDQRTLCKEELENAKVQLANAKEEVTRPFAQEEELKAKSARLDELNILLDMDKRENEVIDEGESSEQGSGEDDDPILATARRLVEEAAAQAAAEPEDEMEM